LDDIRAIRRAGLADRTASFAKAIQKRGPVAKPLKRSRLRMERDSTPAFSTSSALSFPQTGIWVSPRS